MKQRVYTSVTRDHKGLRTRVMLRRVTSRRAL